MDDATIHCYDSFAADFAAEWEDEQPAASDLHDIVSRYFSAGPTIDVGCGSGRDTAWLAARGFDVRGVDASTALLAEASARHPGVPFVHAALPGLAAVPRAQFTNVFCETVIMHLPRHEVAPSVHTLVALLAPGGTLYLSWRVSEGEDKRDAKGRLYSAFAAGEVREALVGTAIELDTQQVSASSGKVVHRIVATRNTN